MVFFLLNCADNFLFLNCSNYFKRFACVDSLYFLVIPWSPGGGKDTGNLPQPDAVGSYKEFKLSLEIFE